MSMTAYTIFAFVFVLIIIYALVLHFRGYVEKDYIDFFCVFSGTYALYSLIGTFDRVGEGVFGLRTSLIVYTCVVTGYISFAIGYSIVAQRHRYTSFESKGRIRLNLIKSIRIKRCFKTEDLVFLILFLFFCVVNYKSILNMIQYFGSGTSYVETSARSARTALSGPLKLFTFFFMLFFLGFPFVRIYKYKEIRILDITILLLQTSFSLSSGHRATLLIMGILVLGIYNYRVRHIKLTKLLIIVLIALPAFVAIGHLRAANSISGMLNILKKANNLRMLKVTSTGEFYNTVGTFFTYVEMIGREDYRLNYGYTWIVELLVYIPFFLFPGRPLPWAEQYMLDFHPEAPAGSGHGWYVLNDGYMSFGVIGILIEMFVLGYVMASLYYFLRKRMDSPYISYMYCIILSYVFLLSRGSFLGAVKNCFLDISPLIFIYNSNNLVKGKIRWKRKILYTNLSLQKGRHSV